MAYSSLFVNTDGNQRDEEELLKRREVFNRSTLKNEQLLRVERDMKSGKQ
jgi:hypothetical protein